jgi:hypothetical protein
MAAAAFMYLSTLHGQGGGENRRPTRPKAPVPGRSTLGRRSQIIVRRPLLTSMPTDQREQVISAIAQGLIAQFEWNGIDAIPERQRSR